MTDHPLETSPPAARGTWAGTGPRMSGTTRLVTTALVGAGLLHLLQALSLGPWRSAWPVLGSWPTPLHLWALETALLAGAAAVAGVSCTRPWWQPRLAATGPAARAQLLTAALVLVQLLLAAAFWLTRDQGVDRLGGLRALFWMGGEFRLPALFAVAQAGLAATLAWQCHQRRPGSAWVAATAVCAYIGIDELLSVHETIGALVQASGWVHFDADNTTSIGGTRSFAWLLLYVPLAAIAGVALLRAFWRAVGPRHLAWLVMAGLAFLGGAVGMELVQAEAQSDEEDWLLTAAGHAQLLIEETLETLGMSLAIRVFAEHAWTPSEARSSSGGLQR